MRIPTADKVCAVSHQQSSTHLEEKEMNHYTPPLSELIGHDKHLEDWNSEYQTRRYKHTPSSRTSFPVSNAV
jgi:hypothetical protein